MDTSKPKVITTVAESYKNLWMGFFAYIKIAEPFLALCLLNFTCLMVFDGFNFNLSMGKFSGFEMNVDGKFWIYLPLLILLWVYLIKAVFGLCRYMVAGEKGLKNFHPLKWTLEELDVLVKSCSFLLISTIFCTISALLILWSQNSIVREIINHTNIVNVLGMPTGAYAGLGIMMSYMVVAYFLITLFMMRFLMFYPARSAGEEIGYVDAFRLFRGMTWRFAVVSVLVLVPIIFIDYAITFVLERVYAFFLTEGKNVVLKTAWVGIAVLQDLFLNIVVTLFLVSYLLSRFYAYARGTIPPHQPEDL